MMQVPLHNQFLLCKDLKGLRSSLFLNNPLNILKKEILTVNCLTTELCRTGKKLRLLLVKGFCVRNPVLSLIYSATLRLSVFLVLIIYTVPP